jgi:hypothetical protein
MTSDDLDLLYDRLDRARDAATLHRKGLLTTTELYAVIEAAPVPDEAATQATEAAWQPDDNLDYDAPPPPARYLDTPLRTGAALPAQEQP